MNKSNYATIFLSACCYWLLLLGGCAQHQAPEVDRCAVFIPPEVRDERFVQWVIDSETDFKQQGCWKQHIGWGKEAIAIASEAGNKKAMMTLSVQLASTYFYLGHFQQCEDSARVAKEEAVALSDHKAEVQSLYLISAAYRARGDIQSVVVAEQALSLCDTYLSDDKALKAKVLFNLGAAESDVKPIRLERAALHLKEAGNLFQEADKKHDVFRVGLRLVRVLYLQGHFNEAEKTIASLQNYDKSPRSEMMYLYQLAKIQHRLNKWQEAGENNSKAYQLAKELGAKKEIERTAKLMEAIDQRQSIDD